MKLADITTDFEIIGKMDVIHFALLKAEFDELQFKTQSDDGFSPSLISPEDRRIARRLDIKLDPILLRNDYALFLNLHNLNRPWVGERVFPHVFEDVHLHKLGDPFCFKGYYAPEHQDIHFSTNIQVIFVLNNSGHRIAHHDYKDQKRRKFITPTVGDILVLNTYNYHALYPNKDLTAEEAFNNPLCFFAVPFYREQK